MSASQTWIRSKLEVLLRVAIGHELRANSFRPWYPTSLIVALNKLERLVYERHSVLEPRPRVFSEDVGKLPAARGLA